MAIGAKPTAEVSIDPSIVRALLQEQHADLPLIEVAEGWDNKLFRLGDDVAIRLPRRAATASLIEQEHRWLPFLAPRLPVPIPAPVRIGRPGCGFPWHWSVVPWFTGQSAALAPPEDPETAAMVLGRFLHALHQPAPGDAPRNPWRGVSLAARAKTVREHLQQLDGLVDRGAGLLYGNASLRRRRGRVLATAFKLLVECGLGSLGRAWVSTTLLQRTVYERFA